jgi:hypothetical protein
MTETQEFERALRQEIKDILPNAIWQTDDGVYSVFGKYKIVPEKPGYRVFCSATDVGFFSTSRSALSWCIADKYQEYNLARDILVLDTKLNSLNSDIRIRATLADRSKDPIFRETIETKLETKIIHKKLVEKQLVNCVNRAKYCQQRGFNNETVRTGRNATVKTSR